MGVKTHKKFYFLELSGKTLICIDSATISPVDSPSGFSGRSSIPGTARCVELKPNEPASSDSFCPNSGVLIPEKSYVEFDSTLNTLILNHAISDGNCGYSINRVNVLLRAKVYTLYVRLLAVYSFIKSSATIRSNFDEYQVYPLAVDYYYYVFSDSNSAINWETTKMAHQASDIISPFKINRLSGSFRIERQLPYLVADSPTSSIHNKYRLRGLPPSATWTIYQSNEEIEPGYDKFDSDIGMGSASYVASKYSVIKGHGSSIYNYLLFNHEPAFPPISNPLSFYPPLFLWPLAYDKIVNINLNRQILDSSLNETIIEEATSKLNSHFGLRFPGIYDPEANVLIQINNVQVYPLEPSDFNPILPDDRFNYPRSQYLDTIHGIVPALYRSLSFSRPNYLISLPMANTIEILYKGRSGTNQRLSVGDERRLNVEANYHGVSNNCDLHYMYWAGNYPNLWAEAGLKRRYITEVFNFRRNIYSSNNNPISIQLIPSMVIREGIFSLKYVIDIIYTVKISLDPLPQSDEPEIFIPPRVCPPANLAVMQNNSL